MYIIHVVIIDAPKKYYSYSSLTLDNCYIKFLTTKDKNVMTIQIQRETKIVHIGRTSMPLRPLRIKYIGSDAPIQAFETSPLANSHLQLAWDSILQPILMIHGIFSKQ